jgi:diguanylate cyclase (GGDEF)-like protein/PAS domain S-box-containing protein
MFVALLLNSMRLMEAQLNERVNSHIRDVELAYNSAIVIPLISRDFATLRDMLEAWCKADDINYMVVTDEGNHPLVAAGNWKLDDKLPTPGQNKNERVVAFPIELEGQVYGNFYFGLSIAYIQSAVKELASQNTLIGILGVLVLLIELAVIVYYLTRNLLYLVQTSQKISHGHFDERVNMTGEDEVAVLAHNFNTMIAAVQSHVAALKNSEQKFRAIADYTYSWESWFDAEGKLQWVNPAVARISGYTPEECMQMENYPLPLVHPNYARLVERLIKQAINGQSGQDQEFRVQHKNGYDVWVAISWQSIYDDNNLSLGFRASIRDVTQQHTATEELAYQAEHDSLTGLHNRHAFERQIKQVLDWQKQDKRSATIFYIDLDQFKIVNDSCGHIAGDQLLIGIAKLLESYATNSFFARLGGDEFGIIFRDLKTAQAMEKAQAIIDSIRNHEFSFSGRTFNISASIGIVTTSDRVSSVSKLFIAADTACYAAKERGRNRAVYYDENDEYFRMRSEEFSSVSHINTALSQGRFLLYFQRLEPLQEHPNNSRNAEVLIRLRDINGNVQTPERFISAAERFNLMPYIDRWVIDNVCHQLALWNEKGINYSVYRFAINVSGASLSDREFPEFVADRIAKYKIDPKRICFEITESCAVGQLELALTFIERMHKLDAMIALDDFGSGLSSFAYLKQFNVDYLKIDGQFVKNLDTDKSDRAVVESMVQLAGAYGLKTVAEYVCNDEIFKIVKELGVTYAQGFACHKPEPLTNLTDYSAE